MFIEITGTAKRSALAKRRTGVAFIVNLIEMCWLITSTINAGMFEQDLVLVSLGLKAVTLGD